MRLPGPERVLQLFWRSSEAGRPHPDALALTAFARFLLLHLAFRNGIRMLEGGGLERAGWALVFGVCFAVALRRPWLRGALIAALVAALSKFAWNFPVDPNHAFLELLCLFLLTLVGPRNEGAGVVASGLRWVPVLVLLWSGVNKVIYGTYFNGAYLASRLPHKGFAFVFGFFLPESELERLLATQPPGPFGFEAWPALAVSNAVYLGEIAAAALLVVPRTRHLGVALAVLVLVGIEAGAREFMFGTLMLNLLALFLPADWSRRLLPASALGYVVLVVVVIWLAPDWDFN